MEWFTPNIDDQTQPNSTRTTSVMKFVDDNEADDMELEHEPTETTRHGAGVGIGNLVLMRRERDTALP